jgi:hypothetical protein
MTALVPSDCGVDFTWAHHVVTGFHGMQIPMMRSCPEWDSGLSSHFHNFRYRVFYTADDLSSFIDEQPTLYMTSLENGVTTEQLPATSTAQWNHTFDEAKVLTPPPTHFTKLSPTQYSDEVVLPFCGVGFKVDREHLKNDGTDYYVKFWAVEYSIEHPVAYTGHHVELTDFEDPPGLHDNAPAPSWLASRLLIDAYNRILYDSTWMFQVALFETDRD